MTKRKPIIDKKSGIASGRIIITIVEAKNLRQSKAIEGKNNIYLQPYVKVTTEVREPGLKPRQLGRSFATKIARPADQTQEGYAELLKLAPFRNDDDPTGHTIVLGDDFKKNMKSEVSVKSRSSLIITMEAMSDILGAIANAENLAD